MQAIILKTNKTIESFYEYMDKFEQQMLKLSNIIF